MGECAPLLKRGDALLAQTEEHTRISLSQETNQPHLVIWS